MESRTETIEKFTDIFTSERIPYKKIKQEYYYVPEQIQKVVGELEKEDLQIKGAGLLLGKQKKYFEPTPYLLEWLSQRTPKKIFVNDKAEWLFLCGRDILTQGIIKQTNNNSKNKSEKYKSELKNKDISNANNKNVNLFLIQNQRDENIGLGLKQKDGTIKNLLDRGDYLRRERKRN